MEGHYGYRLLLLALILAANGFFAAAEVSLVSVRPSRLRHLAESGNLGAQAALSLLARPERLLSVTQFGVTIASLGLGWAGEDTLFEIFTAAFRPVQTPATTALLHGVSLVLSFLVMSFGHVIVGEVLPKNLALERADRLAVLVAPALLVFYRATGPFVATIERTAALASRALGLTGAQHGGGHTPEELKFILSVSREQGHLPDFEGEAAQRVLDLGNYSAREIMVPRNDVISVSLDSGLDQVLRTMIEYQYSRLPVYEGTPEQIVGVLHFKDLLPLWEDRRLANVRRRPARPFRLASLLRQPLLVPETKPLSQLLAEFRQSHSHMALVVDEFGTIVGIVTLEDVLEQIVGEIEDEHDEQRHAPARDADSFELDGTTPIRDLAVQYGVEVPGDAGFETLAGFLLYQLGRVPEPGEVVEHGLRRYTILDMDRNRIARVRVEKLQPQEAEATVSPLAS